MKINTLEIQKRKSNILFEQAVSKASQNTSDEVDKLILKKLIEYARENPTVKMSYENKRSKRRC